ncbi:phenol hydroxylase [Delftia acidovorans]|uniref:Phenol hydroxylase n=1 Tax=Delftia acidovorans TaxID=80866 RepID=A0A7T2VX96_DELAC|nr:phenol hydroxylase subunit [Delftia acidovorans]QPS06731.1 phenol hydroxylase [Delftia acidovorans]
MDTPTRTATATVELPACDLSRRSVRVLQRRANGFVEFEFSVGWPELVVELTMAEPDFQDFCRRQGATVL